MRQVQQGSQTLAFVNKVFSKYTTYCNNISR